MFVKSKKVRAFCHFERSRKSHFKLRIMRFLVALLCRNDQLYSKKMNAIDFNPQCFISNITQKCPGFC